MLLAVGLDKIYGGAHWPTDVVGGVLIATAWLTLVLSVRWITDRAFAAKKADQPRFSLATQTTR